jgi:phage baseplate assembly protein W
MATIIQLSPTSDSINGEATGYYVNQLQVCLQGQTSPNAGLTQPLDFITLVSSPALFIATNGAINTTGTLENGPYTSTGTVTDSGGNTGTWTFTLTVVGVPSPQVALVPQVPLLPTGVEIAVPFQIDPATGGIAYLSSYNQIIEQHVATIVMTAFNERVMLPSYGSPLQAAVFQPIGSVMNAVLANDIKKAIAAWEPSISIVNVTINGNAQSLSELDITVSYFINPSQDVNTVQITSGGTISQVNAL